MGLCESSAICLKIQQFQSVTIQTLTLLADSNGLELAYSLGMMRVFAEVQ